MSILSGFKRVRRFLKTEKGYIPQYEKDIASAVFFGDGTNENANNSVERLNGIFGITDSYNSSSSKYAASQKALYDAVNALNTKIDNKTNMTWDAGTSTLTIDV